METTTIIEQFKEVMHKGMIENFKRNGALSPVLFYLKDNIPNIVQIPLGFLGSSEGKFLLSQTIKNICTQPNVLAAGLIIEAYGAVTDPNDEKSKDLISGEKRVSDLDEKQDIIVMIFSTPEKEELIAYCVDEKEKKLLDRFGESDTMSDSSLAGMFSGFFNWVKN